MKKLLIAGLAVILVALLMLTVATGNIFNQQLDKIAADLAQDPRVQVVASEQDAGWFNSQGELTLAFSLDARVDLLVTSQWQARHRPGWVSYQGSSQIQSDEAGGEKLNVLAELGIDPLPFHGRAGWKKASYILDLQALTLADDDLSIQFSGGQLEAGYEYATGHQTGRLQADLFKLGGGRFNPSSLSFEELLLNWNQQGVYPWVAGDMSFHVDRLHFKGPQGEVSFAQPYLSQNLEVTEQEFELSLDFNSGEVRSGGRDLGKAALSLQTDDFDGQATADLLEFFSQEADWESLSEEAMQPGLAAMNRLLEGSPGILLDHLEVSLVSPLEIKQKAEGSLRFDGQNLPTDYLNRLSSGEIAEDDLISRVRFELLFDKINPELLMLVGIPAFLQDESAEQQSLVWERGELRLNGQRLPF